jgi:sugar O-acyltransferase (sialic acid O-acetyltransferase NeuD family)
MHLSPEADLVIIGAGGHGRELFSYLKDLERAGWTGKLRGYLDDGLAPGLYGRIEVLGPVDSLNLQTDGSPDQRRYLTAFGSNPLRRQMVERLTGFYGEALTPWTLIHPQTSIGEDVEIGEGTCLAPGVILTTRTTIGRHCILNVKASVSHDCRVGDFVNINPGATICGSVTVGEGANIGAGAIVKERISIGSWSVIGAGAVVVRDIPSNVTAVGVPARVTRQH